MVYKKPWPMFTVTTNIRDTWPRGQPRGFFVIFGHGVSLEDFLLRVGIEINGGGLSSHKYMCAI